MKLSQPVWTRNRPTFISSDDLANHRNHSAAVELPYSINFIKTVVRSYDSCSCPAFSIAEPTRTRQRSSIYPGNVQVIYTRPSAKRVRAGEILPPIVVCFRGLHVNQTRLPGCPHQLVGQVAVCGCFASASVRSPHSRRPRKVAFTVLLIVALRVSDGGRLSKLPFVCLLVRPTVCIYEFTNNHST